VSQTGTIIPLQTFNFHFTHYQCNPMQFHHLTPLLPSIRRWIFSTRSCFLLLSKCRVESDSMHGRVKKIFLQCMSLDYLLLHQFGFYSTRFYAILERRQGTVHETSHIFIHAFANHRRKQVKFTLPLYENVRFVSGENNMIRCFILIGLIIKPTRGLKIIQRETAAGSQIENELPN
jgi:hypothetical protein